MEFEIDIYGFLQYIFEDLPHGSEIADIVLGGLIILLGMQFIKRNSDNANKIFGLVLVGVGTLGIISGIIIIINSAF